MVDLVPLLTEMHEGVMSKNPRFTFTDPHTICDSKTGVKYVLYHNKPYEVLVGDSIALTGKYMTNNEANILRNVFDALPELRRESLYNILMEERDTAVDAIEDIDAKISQLEAGESNGSYKQ